MKSTLTFFTLLCAFIYSLPTTFAQSDTLLFEDFEEELDSLWKLESNWATGTTVGLSSEFFIIPGEGRVAAINDDAFLEGNSSIGKLISPPIDLTNIESAMLRFDAYFINGDFGGDETAKVMVTTDDGLTWEVLKDLEGRNGIQSLIIPLEDIYSNQIIRIAFDYHDGDVWNYGYAIDNVLVSKTPDFLALGHSERSSIYTTLSIAQLRAFTFEQAIQNYGTMPLNNTSIDYTLLKNGTEILSENRSLDIPINQILTDTYAYIPTETGDYILEVSVTSEHIEGDIILANHSFEVSDSIMARDDGGSDSNLGFGFGSPSWYGYYGSEFVLNQADSLTALSVFVSEFSDPGSINFTVNAFDSIGFRPDIELFHSPPIKIGNAQIGSWVHYQLPEPLSLTAGRFVFAAGQDTLQGIIGFNFDLDNITPEGFWLISPIAGGGYPWDNAINRETMLIRPHFKNPTTAVGIAPVPIEKIALDISPNPFQQDLNIQLSKEKSGQVRLVDMTGKAIIQQRFQGQQIVLAPLYDLPNGVYFVELLGGDFKMVQKVIKQ